MIGSSFQYLKKDSELVRFSKVVNEIQGIFDTIPCKYMLMNGNIEKPLKFFVGSCLERVPSFSYSMDKRVDRHEIDMIGFQSGIEVFASEFKCTFSYDKNCTKKAAIDACSKINKTAQIERFKNKHKYIVHFLNHSRQNSDSSLNPKWIKEKSPNTKIINAKNLVEIYKDNFFQSPINTEIIQFNFPCKDLGLDAILISL